MSKIKNDEINTKNEVENDKIKKKYVNQKTIIFRKEREAFIIKIKNMLNLQEDNTFFYMDDIDKNKEAEILELVVDVKKYFLYSGWSFFKKTETEKNYISLLKNIFKDMGYNVMKRKIPILENGKKITKTKVYINKI